MNFFNESVFNESVFNGEYLGLRAVIVAVDYTDFLSLTLPYNRHHFKEVWVVTDPETWLSSAFRELIANCNCMAIATDCFYENGASFNKWLALEESLDIVGREGWLCLMDADILWPYAIPEFLLEIGYLYTPLRRMLERLDWNSSLCSEQAFAPAVGMLPPESVWNTFPIHKNIHEWAGYSQIFHASDSHLGQPPWHETNWKHAGGADSFFQRKWPQNRKVRPPFECLHLGPAGVNWCGRVTPYLHGGKHPLSEQRQRTLAKMRGTRRKGGMDPFREEKF